MRDKRFSGISLRRTFVSAATALLIAAATAAVPAVARAAPSAPTTAAPGTPGTSIGTAWPPLQGGTTYSETNVFAGFPEDWYVIYKKTDSAVGSLTIDNTSTSATCGVINAYLEDQNGGYDSALNTQTLGPGSSYTFTVPAHLASDPRGQYYFWVTGDDDACTSAGSATYTIGLTPGAQFSSPGRAPSRTGQPGTSIGNAWPPLRGGISYAQTNYFTGFPQDWYVLDKKPDSHTATVRIVNTSVYGTSCPVLNVLLQDSNGLSDSALDTATLNANSAITFTIPAKLASDPQGLYYLWVVGDDNACGSAGSATYSIEPEPGAEFASPARIPARTGHPGTGTSSAWPPLRGGASYAHTNYFTGFPQDWYALYKKSDSHTATIRVADTSVYGAGCSDLDVWLYDSHGTGNSALDSATLPTDGTVTFTVPGKLSGDKRGLYYLVLQGDDNACSASGSASYTIEPESAAEWGYGAISLPSGTSKAEAKGPLSAGVNYTGFVAARKGAQSWSYFHATGAAKVKVVDIAASSAGCKLDVAAGSSKVSLTSGQLAVLPVTKAGKYYLELTPAAGCAPKSSLGALLQLSGHISK